MSAESNAPGRVETGPEAEQLEGRYATTSSDRLQGLMSIYQRADQTSTDKQTDLASLIHAIRHNVKLAANVRGIREVGATKGRDAAKPLKMKYLQAAMISGVVTQGQRAKAHEQGRFIHSGLLQIDLDAKDHGGITLDRMRQILIEDQRVIAVFLSPSGDGIKGVCRIPADASTHRRAFQAVQKHFADLGLKMDNAPSSPLSLCYFSHDPDAFFDPTRTAAFEPLPEHAPAPPPPNPTKASPDARGGLVLHETSGTRNLSLDDLREMIAVIPRPDYLTWLEICSGAWSKFGVDATPMLMERWPEEKPGEYAEKFAALLTEISFGTVYHYATLNGWRPRPLPQKALTLESHSRPGADKAEVAEVDLWSSLGNADADAAIRIALVADGRVHHVHQTGQWIIWNGCRWQPDHDGGMTRLAIEVADLALRQAVELKDEEKRKKAVSTAIAGRNRQKIVNALALLQAVDGITVSASDLDADPMQLGTPNGVIDLRQGHAVRPDPAMMITKAIAVDPDPSATCPTWLRFIERITDGDRELADFLQAWAGYSLTGSTQEEALAFAYGSGANGKSTFIETLRHLLGDYAVSIPSEVLMIDRNGGRGATPDLARLAGARFAVATETEEGSQLAESRIKSITSHDQITARFLFGQPFDFAPTHKLIISGNHRPRITGTDHGVWRRLRLVPFIVSIPPEERDPHLRDKLKAEQAGILNWMLEGCLRWQRDGLHTPQSVAAATAEYKAAEDVIGQFLAECTTRDPDGRVLQSSLFQAYRQWADEQGIRRQLTANMLNRRLEDRGLTRCKSGGSRFWAGVEMVY